MGPGRLWRQAWKEMSSHLTRALEQGLMEFTRYLFKNIEYDERRSNENELKLTNSKLRTETKKSHAGFCSSNAESQSRNQLVSGCSPGEQHPGVTEHPGGTESEDWWK
ncbi:unnamed protein product [Boreogadus saida]